MTKWIVGDYETVDPIEDIDPDVLICEDAERRLKRAKSARQILEDRKDEVPE